MRYWVTIRGRTLPVDLEPDGVAVDGEPMTVDLAHVAGTRVRSLLLDGASHRLVARRESGGAWELHLRGRRLHAEVVDERTRRVREMTGAGAAPSGPRPVKAPMPGLVIRVEVAEGDRIEVGQGLVIVEAMKMENELLAEGPARVRRVLVSPGEAVEKDQVLLDLAPVDGPE